MPGDIKDKRRYYGQTWGQWGSDDAENNAGRRPNAEPDGETLSVDYKMLFETGPDGRAKLQAIEVEPGSGEEEHRRAVEAAKELLGVRSATGDECDESSLPLATAIDVFLSSSQIAAGSLKNYKSYLCKVALPHFGPDTALQRIDQRAFAKFVDHLSALGKSPSTVEGYVSAFRAMGAWHRSRGAKVPQWETTSLLPKRKSSESEDRAAFSLPEIGALFRGVARYRESQPEKFWISAATAFMGCRVEELAQVNLLTDLHRYPGSDVHYLSFNAKADPDGVVRKSLKKPASQRVAPIHSALVAAGFLEFLERAKSNPHARPFEAMFPYVEVPLGIDGRLTSLGKFSHAWSKWGGRQLRRLVEAGSVNAEGGKTYFHSMRHTLTTHLAAQGVMEPHRAVLVGHSLGGENEKRYSKLRSDPVFLSQLVEGHLTAYASLLAEALEPAPL
jgi:integrase